MSEQACSHLNEGQIAPGQPPSIPPATQLSNISLQEEREQNKLLGETSRH